MEEVSLNETESRYYSDLFLCCDEEKTGKIPMLKATELYRSANLSNNLVLEITSIAGIPPTALHISRAQFYSCLKLIAAHQAAVPLRQELIAASLPLPLPRFSWKESANSCGDTALHHRQVHLNGSNILPPPFSANADRRNSLPRRSELDWQEGVAAVSTSRRNSAAASAHPHHHHQLQQQELEATTNSDVHSTDSDVEQNESTCVGGGGERRGTGSSSREKHVSSGGVGGSPEAWSTNSDSPTPTNSVAERPWAKENLWHGLLGDEHRQLLGTEEESSDRHSSDEDNDETDLETVYQITPEQREYYFKQFKAVQPDPNGLLSGPVARVYFEKSRIPVEQLRHIWQLCDVTRDGALSLAEFTAAMHLVVLRRNNIPLPAILPACLHPNVLQHSTLASQQPQQEPPEADLLHLNDDDEEDKTENSVVGVLRNNEKNAMNLSTLSTSSQTSTSSRHGGAANHTTSLTPPPLPPPIKNRSISNSPNIESSSTPPTLPQAVVASAKVKQKERNLWAAQDVPPTQWTKFTESPTSNVSSPGPKPVNFDMILTAQAVVSDPQILHPVPLRVTPVSGTVSATNDIVNPDGNESVTLRDTSPKPANGVNTSAVVPTTAAAVVTAVSHHHRDSLQNVNDLRAIQRPQAKKLPVKNFGALPPPPQREPSIGSIGSGNGDSCEMTNAIQQQPLPQQVSLVKKDVPPPPLPPPRPHHRHGRSSSLDLNKFKMSAPSGQQPEITAQASFDLQTSTGFADFTHFPDGNFANSEQISDQQQHSLPPQMAVLPPSRFSLQTTHQRVSAFEVYRKPQTTPRNSQSPPGQLTAATSQHSQPTQPPPPAPFGAVGAAAINATHLNAAEEFYDKRVNAISETLRHVSFRQENNSGNSNNMAEVIRHLREQNSLLLRLCTDLSEELLTVQMRKEEMRLKLDATGATATTNEQTTVAPVAQILRTGSSISAPVTANVTGGSGSSGVHSNV